MPKDGHNHFGGKNDLSETSRRTLRVMIAVVLFADASVCMKRGDAAGYEERIIAIKQRTGYDLRRNMTPLVHDIDVMLDLTGGMVGLIKQVAALQDESRRRKAVAQAEEIVGGAGAANDVSEDEDEDDDKNDE